MPPVGMNRTSGHTADIVLIISTPPTISAGNNLTTFTPKANARILRRGGDIPGIAGHAAYAGGRDHPLVEAR